MRLIRGVGLLALAAMFVASTMAVSAEELSLYKRLGEDPGISYLVQTFLEKVAGDARINKRFAKTNIPKLKKHVVDFIDEATGGPQVYKGKDMRTAHKGMGISQHEFNSFADDFVWALNKTVVGKQEQKELMKKLAALAPQIVEEKPQPAAPVKPTTTKTPAAH